MRSLAPPYSYKFCAWAAAARSSHIPSQSGPSAPSNLLIVLGAHSSNRSAPLPSESSLAKALRRVPSNSSASIFPSLFLSARLNPFSLAVPGAGFRGAGAERSSSASMRCRRDREAEPAVRGPFRMRLLEQKCAGKETQQSKTPSLEEIRRGANPPNRSHFCQLRLSRPVNKCRIRVQLRPGVASSSKGGPPLRMSRCASTASAVNGRTRRGTRTRERCNLSGVRLKIPRRPRSAAAKDCAAPSSRSSIVVPSSRAAKLKSEGPREVTPRMNIGWSSV
jgi:hypothetical protein